MNDSAKDIIYGDEARAKIKAGVQKLAKAVKVTLGPCGRNVVSKVPFEDSPTVTKDGVSVAKEITLADTYEDMGAQMVKEVASKTSDVAGDGTTTATVYAEAIYLEGLRNVAAGANPMEMKRGIDIATETVVAAFAGMSAEVDDTKQVEQVATCSTNHDEELGALIAEAMEKVGKDGVITVEEGRGYHTTVDYVDGLQFDKGFLSPHFLKGGAPPLELNNPFILLCDKKITRAKEIVAALSHAAESQGSRPLLVIADGVEGEALGTMIVNTLRGTLQSCAVKSPGFGIRAKAMLDDLAIVTCGTVFSDQADTPLDDKSFKPGNLGSAKKVIVDKDTCTIIEGGFGKDDLDENERQKAVDRRVAAMREEIEETKSDWDKEKLEERIAMITGSIARVYVGAATETEIKEKKARVEDALHASRAAIEEGVLPGGGVAAVRASKAASKDRKITSLKGDQRTGAEIVLKAMSAPLLQIVKNAGKSAEIVLHNVQASDDRNYGYDALKGEYADMLEAGIIVPTKVERTALQHAASIAGLMLTTEAMIGEVPDDKKEENPTIPM